MAEDYNKYLSGEGDLNENVYDDCSTTEETLELTIVRKIQGNEYLEGNGLFNVERTNGNGVKKLGMLIEMVMYGRNVNKKEFAKFERQNQNNYTNQITRYFKQAMMNVRNKKREISIKQML